MRKGPNIVFVTVDSLRADFVGYQNPKEKNTPFLDNLAKKSYVYTHAIVPSLPTPFCFPAMMLGNLPFTYGKYLGIPDDPKIKTIAEILKSNGYSTYAFLADNPMLYSIYGYQKGFDIYNDGFEDTNKTLLSSLTLLWKIREKIPQALLNILEPTRTFIKALFLSPTHAIDGTILNKKIMHHFTNKHTKPFFLWIHYMDNHLPYFGGLSKNFFKNKNQYQRLSNKITFYKELTSSMRKAKTKNKHINEIFKEAYRNSIKKTDTHIGEIVNFLKEKNPNTVFMITSDHGESFMEHGVIGHGSLSLYNELIHIPLIINLPTSESKTVTNMVSVVSIAKTVASIAGVKVSQFKGNNLLQDSNFSPINNLTRILFRVPAPNVQLGIFDNKTEIRGYNCLWSYTTPKEKYIVEEDGDIEEYYLLTKDPGEKNNLINHKAMQNAKIISQLQKFIKSKYS